MAIFDINNVAFEIIGYPISYVEMIGTLFGFALETSNVCIGTNVG
jgi:hypothetical protein